MSSTRTPRGQMPGDAKSILEAALALSEQERAEMAAQLIQSIDDEQEQTDEAAIDEAWATEAESRYQAYKSGEMKAISIEEFLEVVR